MAQSIEAWRSNDGRVFNTQEGADKHTLIQAIASLIRPYLLSSHGRGIMIATAMVNDAELLLLLMNTLERSKKS